MSKVVKIEMNESFTVEGITDFTSQSDEIVESYIRENKIGINVTPKMKSLLTTLEGLQKIMRTSSIEYSDDLNMAISRMDDNLFDELRDEIKMNLVVSYR